MALKLPMERILPVLDKLVIASLFTFVAFSMFSISATQIDFFLGGLIWLFRTHITSTWREQRGLLGIPFVLFALACLVAVASAYDVGYSYKSLKKLLQILIFFWVINCVREDRLRDSLSLALIVAATGAGLFGFYQAWRDEVTVVVDGVTALARVTGTLSVYTTFAGLLMMVGMLALGRVVFRRPREPWLWLAVLVITGCLLFTLTRQAWFGFLVGLAFIIFVWKRKIFLILAVLLVSAFFVFAEYGKPPALNMSPGSDQTFQELISYRIQRMFSGEDETFLMRKALWLGGWEIFKDYPLTGCGFRCVDLLHSQYPDPTGFVARYRGMHNNFIQLAVDTGILGLTAWLGIWVCFFRLLYQRASALEGDPSARWVVVGSAAAVIAFLAGGCFESNFYDSEVAMVLYFIMALPFTGSRGGESVSTENAGASARA